MRFKKNKVWVWTDQDGAPVEENGRVLVKYQLGQDYEYRVNASNIGEIDSAIPEGGLPEKPRRRKEKTLAPDSGFEPGGEGSMEPAGAVCVYADGASSGNPGPSGIGVLLRFGTHEKEISAYIGEATNNIAELEAIRAALSAIKDPELPVRIYTDSSYAHGVLSLGWKPKKNLALIEKIKNQLREFRDVKLIKVKGHAGMPGNERADLLARSALKKSTAMK